MWVMDGGTRKDFRERVSLDMAKLGIFPYGRRSSPMSIFDLVDGGVNPLTTDEIRWYHRDGERTLNLIHN